MVWDIGLGLNPECVPIYQTHIFIPICEKVLVRTNEINTLLGKDGVVTFSYYSQKGLKPLVKRYPLLTVSIST